MVSLLKDTRRFHRFYILAPVVALLMLGLVVPVESGAAFIEGVSIEDYSTQYNGRKAINTVNGSGWDDSTDPAEHNTTTSDMWLTDNEVSGAFIEFDLGSVHDVIGFRVWNYNEDGQTYSDRSVKDLQISVSETGSTYTTLTDPTDSDQTYTFEKAPGSTEYTGEAFYAADDKINAFTARYVHFDVQSNYPDPKGTYTGLSEIRFAVPEPSSYALLALAVAVLMLSRVPRKRLQKT